MFGLPFLQKEGVSDPDPNYEVGEICEVIRQGYEWRIKARGSYWPATSTTPIHVEVGDYVRIVGVQGIGLLINVI